MLELPTCGFSEIFYKGKIRDFITFWILLKGREHTFKVANNHLNDPDGAIKSIRHKVIDELDMNYLPHIRFKSRLLKQDTC